MARKAHLYLPCRIIQLAAEEVRVDHLDYFFALHALHHACEGTSLSLIDFREALRAGRISRIVAGSEHFLNLGLKLKYLDFLHTLL